jgi:hypothetical protein
MSGFTNCNPSNVPALCTGQNAGRLSGTARRDAIFDGAGLTRPTCEIPSSGIDGSPEAKFLLANHHHYQSLVAHLHRIDFLRSAQSAETGLNCVELIARFASSFHCGHFADGAVENVGLQIGGRLESLCSEPGPLPTRPLTGDGRRHVLHVASATKDVGGPTRTILNWIINDAGARHSLVVVGQGRRAIPSWLSQAVAATGGDTIALPDAAPLLQKAAWLRRISQAGVDVVITHHYTFDVVPLAAFATDDCPPVGLVDHSDHVFWLGGCVADAVVSLRAVGGEMCRRRRFVRSTVPLPIPLPVPAGDASRADARRRLNIPASQVMLLSVGSVYKYVPAPARDFRRTILRLLEQNPGAHFYLVAWAWDGDCPAFLQEVRHDRFHYIGDVRDASDYQSAADVYLEGFPFGSQTAFLEAGLSGLPAVRAFAPASALMVTNDLSLDGVVGTPVSEEEYIAQAEKLIRDVDERGRAGRMLSKSILDHHTGNGWRRHLSAAYDSLGQARHWPHPIPTSTFAPEPVDLAVSAWHATKGRTPADGAEAEQLRDGELRRLIWDIAYGLREGGDYGEAFRLLRLGGRLTGWDTRAFSALAKLTPHWATRRFSRRPSSRRPSRC